MKKIINEFEKVTNGVTKGTEAVIRKTEGAVVKTEKVLDKEIEYNRRVLEKHPFLFGFLGTFGSVAVVTGFEGVIERIQYVNDNPAIVMFLGLFILFMTGALYKRLLAE